MCVFATFTFIAYYIHNKYEGMNDYTIVYMVVLTPSRHHLGKADQQFLPHLQSQFLMEIRPKKACTQQIIFYCWQPTQHQFPPVLPQNRVLGLIWYLLYTHIAHGTPSPLLFSRGPLVITGVPCTKHLYSTVMQCESIPRTDVCVFLPQKEHHHTVSL